MNFKFCSYFFIDIPISESCNTDVETCLIDNFSTYIRVECTFSSNLITSFQVIAQLAESDEVCRLIVSQNVNSAATIEVDSDRVYLITVLPIRSGSGIDSCQYTIGKSVIVVSSCCN